MQAAGKSHNKKSQYNDYDYYTPNNIKDKIVDGTNRCTSRYTEKLRDLLVKELKLLQKKN